MKRTLSVLSIMALACLLSRPFSEAVAQKQSTAEPLVKSSKTPALLIAPFDKVTGLKKQQEWVKHLGKRSHIEKNSIGMEMVLIPPGEYLRGATDAEIDKMLRDDKKLWRELFTDQKPRHRVRITRPYWMGKTEVTQSQWKAVMETEPWKGRNYVKEGDDYPATYVSWDDAQEFVKKLNAKEGGAMYRLPTEGEWEHACRAGTTTRWSFGDDASDLGEYAWFDKNAFALGEIYAHPVGQKLPNSFGLLNMHGNVCEWCSDWYGENEYLQYASKTAVDPFGPRIQTIFQRLRFRVLRGGAWNDDWRGTLSADRCSLPPDVWMYNVGFRLVRTS